MNDPSVRFDLDDWAFLELVGDERLDWLQGQATNDMRELVPGRTLSFCLCEPTGQMLSVVDAWALPDRIVMATPRQQADAVLERVERMTILEDVAARPLTGRAFSVQGSEATGDLGLSEASGDAVQTGGVLYLRSRRTSTGGWDVLILDESEEGLDDRFPLADPKWSEAARIGAGLPKWGVDVGPRTLPPEMGPDFEARHVSYAKGCYTGQEVLMRMHSRGHTNRTWVGLVADEPVPVGEAVLHEGREVGRVSSASPQPLEVGFVAAAILRNEAAMEGAEVVVGKGRAEVRRMPILPTA